MELNDGLKNKIKSLPKKSGIYMMKNIKNEVIYIGKAKNLKKRVSQYFFTNNHSKRIECMIENINDFSCTVTSCELDALFLECSLIKKFLPKYNILLKDSKTYPYIKCNINEDYPFLLVTKKIENNNDLYKGPFKSVALAEEFINIISKMFKIRKCFKNLKNKKESCIYYQIDECSGPCIKKISKEEYKNNIKLAIKLLEPPFDVILKELKKNMNYFSLKEDFKKSKEIKNIIEIIKKTNEDKTLTFRVNYNSDAIGLYKDKYKISIVVLKVRNGKIVESLDYVYNKSENEIAIFKEFLKQFYVKNKTFIEEIILPVKLKNTKLLAKALYENNNRKIEFIVPKKGKKLRLLEIALINANQALKN